MSFYSSDTGITSKCSCRFDAANNNNGVVNTALELLQNQENVSRMKKLTSIKELFETSKQRVKDDLLSLKTMFISCQQT